MEISMMQLAVRLTLFLLLFVALDFYVFQAVKVLSADSMYKAWIQYGYWIINIGIILIIAAFFLFGSRRTATNTWIIRGMIGLFLLVNVPKLIVICFLLTEDIARIVIWAARAILNSNETRQAVNYMPSRRHFISTAAVLVAAIPFAAIIHGIWKGRYNFTTRKVTLTFDHLPPAFDGFTITQLSDIHIGSFDNVEAVERGLAMANAAKSDLLVFTGDLVNNLASEMEPWIPVLSKLKASMGKFSVFGNHDYGDYIHWDSAVEKANNLDRLKQIHKEIGMDLLCNEHRIIERNGQQIAIVGVENWGLPPFPQHGDLDKATKGLAPDVFKVLLSHDPSHWDAKAVNHSSKPALALAGHTHGMQFGIEIPGFRWSPVKFKYPKWADLYENNGQYLYVNRGFGFLAFPGRVGIWPEITQFTLRRKA
jgi:hypothetical protein